MPSPLESSCIYNLLNESKKLPKVVNRLKSSACLLWEKEEGGRIEGDRNASKIYPFQEQILMLFYGWHLLISISGQMLVIFTPVVPICAPAS